MGQDKFDSALEDSVKRELDVPSKAFFDQLVVNYFDQKKELDDAKRANLGRFILVFAVGFFLGLAVLSAATIGLYALETAADKIRDFHRLVAYAAFPIILAAASAWIYQIISNWHEKD